MFCIAALLVRFSGDDPDLHHPAIAAAALSFTYGARIF